ncbi:MAG: cob(I)yrinic acid a,c-diamide adenosyltransferase [Candidatus Omnitrophota bacterium]|jgi:ATP:cob(I)alamin adenosyltransferase
MGITTKTGDSGKTSLCFGERVFKDDLRVIACGTLDELCSSIGMAKSLAKDKRAKEILCGIQRDLFIIGAEIATDKKRLSKLKERIDADFVFNLEELIKQLEGKKKSEPCCFCLPGENQVSSSFDISRTIARRAERVLVALKRKKIIKNPDMLIYLNRLSDLLYLFARDYEKKPKRK